MVKFKKDEIDIIEKEKTVLKNKLLEIESNENTFIKKSKTNIQSWIDRMPNKKPIKNGNITMRAYLFNCKKDIEDNPNNFIMLYKSKLNKHINKLDEVLISQQK